MLKNREMLLASDHMLAWAVYGVAAALVLLILWRITRRWQWDTRWLLLALTAVLVVTPSPVPGHEDLMAPAMIFLALGGMTGGAEVIAPALVRLSLAGILAIILVVIAGFWHRRNVRRARQRAETENRRRRDYT